MRSFGVGPCSENELMATKMKFQVLTEKVADTLVKFAIPPPIIRILPERKLAVIIQWAKSARVCLHPLQVRRPIT